jgi:DNA processing protein
MPSTSDEKIYQIALSILPQIGVVNARRLIAHVGSAKQIFHSSLATLQKIPHIGPVLSQAVHASGILTAAQKIWESCQKEGIQVLFYTDSNFPNRLKHIYDAPLLVYWQGSTDLNSDQILAVVGTRKASEYGKQVCRTLIRDAAAQQVLFVSGLAYGIDICMHQTCLEFRVPNIAVLAGGFHWIYPPKHRRYVEKIKQHGGILSEHPLHQKPDARFFPLRNRIIAGMSDATLVVEAAERGGALITADYANNYHREVFAVPGNIQKIFSEGCNLLIQKHKANIFTSWKALCEELNWFKDSDSIQRNKNLHWNRFTEEESALLALLHQKGELPLDEIAWNLQKNMSELALLVLNLEFQGVIKSLPGHRYVMK